MDLVKTHLLLAQEQEKQLERKNFLSNTNSLNGFWDGANFMGILNTIGGTWSQIEQAKNGQPVYVQNPNGEQQNIAPLLLQKLEEQAKAHQTSVENLVKVLKENTEKEPPKKDNTLLYVGIGAGVLVLLGGIYVITKK